MLIQGLAALSIALTAGTIETDSDKCGTFTVEYVGGDEWPFNRITKTANPALAARFPDGSRAIFVNVDDAEDQSEADLDMWIAHERSHLDAWCDHGFEIEEHGQEFRRACRKRVTRRASYFCKGYF